MQPIVARKQPLHDGHDYQNRLIIEMKKSSLNDHGGTNK